MSTSPRERRLNSWHAVMAGFLGWTLDAFDFFLLVFVLKDIAAEFHTEIGDVTFAILLTLAMVVLFMAAAFWRESRRTRA